ncbi:ubiquitin carboxyl-terminal family 1 protein, putative [Ichthyophthirius multifiliis]|uniref:Ubiquitin carboxyl-terminal hydrolase n=1 Tax=Ichthyophthirius multifiliis TaxID=5932 RepID=G0QXM4_ICHMU|nr:ubiquitin carboxyl-terminal family 1 protein, putative [Ichthyophthirius multifiliis]EGR30024.1 ubiquitin carboxyl-terminal family 1 protein, putative [Ichthyophthirius multifiliis]|eukprot:XP_004031260.1 ubiquitin carboxyl-terminal family 1 protein, putative [Ichthyophthirius multifiliis]
MFPDQQNEHDNWFPLESNPDVINPYIQNLGFDTSKYQWVDLMSTEDWAQEMLPKPCVAVVFLFPITENTIKYDQEEEKKQQQVDAKVYFMKQFARNACGTVGVMHAMLNMIEQHPELAKKDSILEKFYAQTSTMTPEQRGNYFLQCKELKHQHCEAVEQGQAQMQEDVNTHFVCFIEKNGHIYELDGRKKSPVNHGNSNSENFLKDACILAKKLMERDPQQVNFTILALCKAEQQI